MILPFDTLTLSAATRVKLIALLNVHRQPRMFSLTDHIAFRLNKLLEGEEIGQAEAAELAKLNSAKNALELLKLEQSGELTFEELYKAFDKAWVSVREFYIRFRTRGIISTVSTAIHPTLRTFSPQYLIFDEASQIVEAKAVAVIAKYFNSVIKVVDVGDVQQLGPFAHSLRINGFSSTTQVSLMEKAGSNWIPDFTTQASI